MQLDTINIAEEFDSIFNKDYTEIQKVERLIKLCFSTAQLNTDILKQKYSKYICQVIQLKLGDLSSDSQSALLDLVEILTTRGIGDSYFNEFYNQFYESGLITKIQILLKQRFIQEKESQKLQISEITYQLVRIFMYAMKMREISIEFLQIISFVITNNINSLIIQLKTWNNNKQQKNEKNQEIWIESDMRNTAKIIHGLARVASCNGKYFIKSIQLIKSIAALIHLNCCDSLKCQKLIIVPCSSVYNELRKSVFDALYEITLDDDIIIKQYLINVHNIFSHFTYLFKEVITQHQYPFIVQNIQTINSFDTSAIILIAIELLHVLLYYPHHVETALFTSNLVKTLIILLKFNNINNMDEALEIRKGSFHCLSCIQERGIKGLQILINANYAGSLTNWIGEGYKLLDNYMLRKGIHNFSNFMSLICQYNQKHPQFSYLKKRVEEQIEKDGGMEEIETNIFCSNSLWGYVKKNAFEIKNNLIFQFQDISNKKQWY